MSWLSKIFGKTENDTSEGNSGTGNEGIDYQEAHDQERGKAEEFGEYLLYEGTPFHLYRDEDLFYNACKEGRAAAFIAPFKEFWNVVRRHKEDYYELLLCSQCLEPVRQVFRSGIDPNLGPLNEDPIPEATRKAICPECSSSNGIIVIDATPAADVNLSDLQSLRLLWQKRALLWRQQTGREKGLCDICSTDLQVNEGYLHGTYLVCEACAQRRLGEDALHELQRNKNYFGEGELRRARAFAREEWNFDPPRFISGDNDLVRSQQHSVRRQNKDDYIEKIEAAAKEFREIALQDCFTAVCQTQGNEIPEEEKKDFVLNAMIGRASNHVMKKYGLSNRDILSVINEAFKDFKDLK